MNKKDILYFSLLLISILLFHVRIIFYSNFIDTPDFGRSDAFHMSISTKYILWKNLQNNTIPLWSSQIGTGFPVLAEGQIGTFHLPNLVLYTLFDFPLAYNASIVLAYILFALGTYVYFRQIGFDSLFSFLGSLTLTFSGLLATHLTHITLLQSLSLMPWIFFTVHTLTEKRNLVWAGITAIIFSQQFLAGFPQLTFIALLYSLAIVLWQGKVLGTWRKSLLLFAIACIITGLLSAIQLLPSQEFLKQTADPNGFDARTASYYSYPLKHLLTFISPFLLGNPREGTYPPFSQFNGSIFWENTGYFGIIPLVFLPFAILQERRKKDQKLRLFFVSVAAGTFLLMLGKYSPLYFIYSYWPFNLFRVPSRFIILFVFALVSLCFLGIYNYYSAVKHQLARFVIVALILVNAVYLMQVWNRYHSFNPVEVWLEKPEITKYVSSSDRVYTVGNERVHNETFYSSGWKSIKPYVFLKNSLYPNSNAIWDISHAQASVGRFLRRNSFMDQSIRDLAVGGVDKSELNDQALKLLRIQGVNKIVALEKIENKTTLKPAETLSSDTATLQLFNLEIQNPRFYAARTTYNATTVEDAFKIFFSDEYTPQQTVLLESEIGISTPSAEVAIDLKKDTDTRLEFEVTPQNKSGILVLTDTYYPGWKAYIDDVPTPIYPANISERAVVVPEGKHKVKFVFESQSFRSGVVISAISYSVVTLYLLGRLILNKRKQ